MMPFLIFFFWIHFPFGQNVEAAKPKATPYYAHPTEAQYLGYIATLFETDKTVWVFQSLSEFERALNHVKLPKKLRTILTQSLTQDVAMDVFFDWDQFMPHLDRGLTYLVLDPELQAQLPQSLIQRFTESLMRVTRSPPISFYYPNYAEAMATVDRLEIPAEARETLRRFVVPLEQSAYLLLNPTTWRALPLNMRALFIDQVLQPGPASEAKSLKLKVRRGTDIDRVASKYGVGGRGKSALRRFLLERLQNQQSATIPFVSLLHPFIQNHLFQFEACHGPNCFFAALSTHPKAQSPKNLSKRHIPDSAETRDQMVRTYRFVESGDPLCVGDLLVYTDQRHELVHMASYVGDGFVFTKNGLTKFSPYVIQSMAQVEHLYQDFAQNLIVMRPVASPTKSALKAQSARAQSVQSWPVYRRLTCAGKLIDKKL